MRPYQSASLVVILLAMLVAGCAGRGGGAGRADTSYVARDVNTLYAAGRDRLDRTQFKLAAALFDEVERQHPYSVWARRAQLMSAYSYYLEGDHTASIASAQRFLAIHPGNRDAPYAHYLIAQNYYEQIADVTRDQRITQQAMDAMGEVIRRYPSTRYAADARLKMDLISDHLAGKEMEIGRFYQRRSQWLASIVRFRRVVDEYDTTSHTPEALMRLVESYLNMGIRQEAERTAAVLGANYPGTEWYSRAFDLVRRNVPDARIVGAPDPASQAATTAAATAG